LEAIVKAENIDVTEEELEKEVQKMADLYRMTADQVKEALGSLDFLKEDIKLNKAVQLLVEHSKTVA